MALFQITDLYPHLKNPHKYIGTRPVTMRSGWEISYCLDFLDKHSSVLTWNSEGLVIPYRCPVRNNSIHRYFPDIDMTVKEANGTIKRYIVEIKPQAEINPITPPKRQTKAFILKCQTWMKNQAKWSAAREYCSRERTLGHNIEFVLMSEKGITYESGRFEKVCFFRV